MRKIWLGAFSLVALYGCANNPLSSDSHLSSLPQGVSLIEEVKAEPGKAMIPYSKYQLDNGLTVILSPDDSDPLVHVDVTYHVGSAREEIGKSGFAHFFEHMMFQGSEHVGDQEHFKIITEAGEPLMGLRTATEPTILKPCLQISWKKCCGWSRIEWASCLMPFHNVSLRSSVIR